MSAIPTGPALSGNAIIAQSGGPTAVINQSLVGCWEELESNGLEVILSEDHSLPIVAVNLWYHAGPINEAPGRTGFAHLFEQVDLLERWLDEGRLDSVAPGEPAINEEDLRSFLNASLAQTG